MFENLTNKFEEVFSSFKKAPSLDEKQVDEGLKAIRQALLEADVALPVVKSFIERIKERAIGEEVGKSLTPGQALVKIIHNELIQLFGNNYEPLNLKAQPPVVIILVGLQGAGKTTTAAKLAKRLIDTDKKRVMLVSVDIHRPAAILQLQTLAAEIGAIHCASDSTEKPEIIMERAIDESRRLLADILIVDTAGRLHVDDTMWKIEGPDLAEGRKVTVKAVDGVILCVEPQQTTP